MKVVSMMTLPIGIDDFREIRERNKYYVDKTLLIRDFIQYDDKVALVTRPRRFGKTLNITMLREFFDNTKDSKAIFADLAIMKTEYAEQINSKPVIYLTFKNCSGATIDDLKDSLASQMVKEYIRFDKEFKGKIDETDMDYFIFYQTYEALKEVLKPRPKHEREISQVDTGLFKKSLTTLIRTVSNFYDHPPLLLIDEYDQPLINAHDMRFREAFSKLIFADFLGEALKGNEHLGQNLLTGIQRIAKESIFSKLNHFSVYSVIDEMYAPYFGLTEAETKVLLETVGLSLTDDIKRYYDGYIMGGINIYNPWSILSYMLKRRLEPYWANTSTNGLIKETIPKADKGFHADFERLILDKEIRVPSNLETSFVELATPQTLWGLLVNAGYLTVTKVYPSVATRIKIPNEEVKKEFREIVSAYTQVSVNKLGDLFNALFDQEMEEFLRLYQGLVYDYVSYYDVKAGEKTSSKHLENSYHMLFLGMSISVSGLYEITSNLEAGHGRGDARLTKMRRDVESLVETDSHNFFAKNEQYRSHDITMKSLQPELRPHIIVELKEGSNVEKLKQEALDQIFEKKYYVKLRGCVLCVGLAHSMKECELVHQEIIVNEYGEISR